MAKRILSKIPRIENKFFKSNGDFVVMRDVISAKERLRIPFKYRWLKFKIKYFGAKLP